MVLILLNYFYIIIPQSSQGTAPLYVRRNILSYKGYLTVLLGNNYNYFNSCSVERSLHVKSESFDLPDFGLNRQILKQESMEGNNEIKQLKPTSYGGGP